MSAQQHTIAGAFLKAAADQLPQATEAECVVMARALNSEQLRRMIARRTRLESIMDENSEEIATARTEWGKLQRNIDRLTRMGVQP